MQGSKYQQGRDVKETAKLIRSEIRSEVRAGRLPKGKYSVTIERYSLGQSINIRVNQCDEALVKSTVGELGPGWDYTVRGSEVIRKLEGILQSYNRDNSDPMTDYFDVQFYGHAEVGWSCGRRPARRPDPERTEE